MTVGKFGTGIFSVSSPFLASLPTGPQLRRASFDDGLQVVERKCNGRPARRAWQLWEHFLPAAGAGLWKAAAGFHVTLPGQQLLEGDFVPKMPSVKMPYPRQAAAELGAWRCSGLSTARRGQ